MNFGIVGCGLIGTKRAKSLASLPASPGHRLVAVADLDMKKAQSLAEAYPGCQAMKGWREVARHTDIQAVLVSTTHDQLVPVGLVAATHGKHLLLEKPGARQASELRPLAALASKKKLTVKVGFNHRFHPAASKAKEILASGVVGPLLYIRATYGHGGRPGYQKEWRADKKISGGGELIDQGMHLIDLSRMFLGELNHVSSFIPTYFWKMKVEDNAFMLLKTKKGQAAWLHASWTDWKNQFSFEIFGCDAKLHWQGLGGSYGPERLVHYQMKPEMGPPDVFSYEFPGVDRSFELEMQDFVDSVASKRRPQGDIQDALAALTVVDAVYKKGGKP